jgi:hypothetical protein
MGVSGHLGDPVMSIRPSQELEEALATLTTLRSKPAPAIEVLGNEDRRLA